MSTAPKNIPLVRVRGDTFPIVFTLKDSAGVAIDITGRTFLLSINTLEDPPDDTTEILQLTGTVPVGTDGVFSFTPTAMEADISPADLYYDVQMTTGSSIRTIIKSTFQVLQDITK